MSKTIDGETVDNIVERDKMPPTTITLWADLKLLASHIKQWC
jgi:hypothetical protein